MPSGVVLRLKLTVARLRRRILTHHSLVRKGLVTVALLVLVLLSLRFLLPTARLVKEFLFGPVNIFSVVLRQGPELRNDNGRTNILLLGIGGVGHEGPTLTDAMMLLSIKTQLDKNETNLPPVVLVSIPRDIYLDSLQDKINFAYEAGLEQGVGTVLVKSVVGQVTGLPVHYVVVADFSVFEKVVDILRGIDVTVEHTLDDPGYPITGKDTDTCGYPSDEVATRSASISLSPASEIAAFPCRYESLHFDTGLQHMDGATALKFVRSRHAEGSEGTDFARSRRQQLVLKAIKDKVLSGDTLLSPGKIFDIYSQLKSHLQSDLDSSEINMLIGLSLKYRAARIKTTAFDQSLLDNPPLDRRGWILLPKEGNWDQVHDFVKRELESQ